MAHCGSCGNACAQSDGVVSECIDAECYAHCREHAGQAVSIDFSTDPANCGRCGRTCGGDLRCVAGRCDCDRGTACGDSCVDTDADEAHCGGCDRACPRGARCNDGACACPNGQTDCDGVCVNLDADAAHCGRCANSCPGAAGGEATCRRGECQNPCGDGGEICGGACTQPAEDPAHCGACDNDCQAFVDALDGRGCPARANTCTPNLDGCGVGVCRARLEFTWNRIDLLEEVSCDALCEARDLTCATSQRAFAGCAHLRDRDYAFNGARDAIGCGVFADSGASPAGVFLESCYAVMDGFGGNGRHREATSCLCEARDGQAPLTEGGPDDVSAGGVFQRPRIASGRADRMLLVLEEGSFVNLDTDGNGDCVGDTVLDLRREGGARIEINDDANVADRCAAVNRRLDAGRYELRVRTFDGAALGAWALRVTVAEEQGFDTVRAPTVLELPALPANGYHSIRLELDAPASLVLDTPDCPTATSLNVIAFTSRSFQSDDVAQCARVERDVPADTFVIRARGRGGRATGPFRLVIDW